MHINEEFYFLAEQLSQILGMGRVIDIRERSMDVYEKGFSGAEIFRMECLFESGKKDSFICKKADLKERMVMQRLTVQGHCYTPAAYSDDCVSIEPRWMIQQDLGKRVVAPRNNPDWMLNVASAFAEIHGNNMNRADEMPWLPHANADYWNKIVTQISVSHFEKAVCEDADFARQFESVLPKLQAEGKRFADDMVSLCEESEWMTLTHGDVQDIDGSHVYNVHAHPYIIDFGFSRYAPFYIDLVDYFSLEEALSYRQALADKGFCVNPKDFEERFRIASKYPGFIYMFPGIMQWKSGSENRLIRCLRKILNNFY
jgi:hypothetical protein